MTRNNLIKKAQNLKAATILRVEENTAQDTLFVYIRPHKHKRHICPFCNKKVSGYDVKTKELQFCFRLQVRSLFQKRVQLCFPFSDRSLDHSVQDLLFLPAFPGFQSLRDPLDPVFSGPDPKEGNSSFNEGFSIISAKLIAVQSSLHIPTEHHPFTINGFAHQGFIQAQQLCLQAKKFFNEFFIGFQVQVQPGGVKTQNILVDFFLGSRIFQDSFCLLQGNLEGCLAIGEVDGEISILYHAYQHLQQSHIQMADGNQFRFGLGQGIEGGNNAGFIQGGGILQNGFTWFKAETKASLVSPSSY